MRSSARSLNPLARGYLIWPDDMAGRDMAGREFSPAPVPRGSAHTAYWKRFLGAYGSHRSRAEAPHRTFRTKYPAPASDRRPCVELPTTVASVAGRRWGAFVDSSLARIPAQSRAGIEFPRARVPHLSPGANFLLRQCCAPLRSSRSGIASWLLTPQRNLNLRTSTNTINLGVQSSWTRDPSQPLLRHRAYRCRQVQTNLHPDQIT